MCKLQMMYLIECECDLLIIREALHYVLLLFE